MSRLDDALCALMLACLLGLYACIDWSAVDAWWRAL